MLKSTGKKEITTSFQIKIHKFTQTEHSMETVISSIMNA